VNASSAAADPGWPEDAVEVGRIVDAWGVKGWFKVQPFASDPQALFSSRRWFIKPPDEKKPMMPPAAAANAYPALLKITLAKEHGDAVLAQSQDIADRAGAQALRGARVFVGRSSFPSAGPDEYYWVDLIGLRVVNRQGEVLGTVAGLIDNAAHSVLRVVTEGGSDESPQSQRLIPFVAAYVDDVSLDQRLITVDWGLDY
jgi:16S rRNA processing protein RimM